MPSCHNRNRIGHLQSNIRLISLVGAGGCGKEKKGKVLQQLIPSLHRLVMSDLIDQVKKDLAAHSIDHTVKNGGLIDDELVIELFQNSILNAHDHGARLILCDGFPRSIGQASWLLNSRIPFSVLFIRIDECTSVARIAQRAQENGPRSDDGAAINRFRTYKQKTLRGIRTITKFNHSLVKNIEGVKLSVREQLVRMLRHICGLKIKGVPPLDTLLKMLDQADHPAHRAIQTIEKPIITELPSRHHNFPESMAASVPYFKASTIRQAVSA